eukprot:2344684-Amphidinium_carterae.2
MIRIIESLNADPVNAKQTLHWHVSWQGSSTQKGGREQSREVGPVPERFIVPEQSKTPPRRTRNTRGKLFMGVWTQNSFRSST